MSAQIDALRAQKQECEQAGERLEKEKVAAIKKCGAARCGLPPLLAHATIACAQGRRA
jgi:hypothetical protein